MKLKKLSKNTIPTKMQNVKATSTIDAATERC